METTTVLHPVISEGESWVLFSEVLNAAKLADPKAANKKCEIAPVIERIPLPGFDQRERYIRLQDIPALLKRYRRISPEQNAAFHRILSQLAPGIDGEKTGQTSADNVANFPINKSPKPERAPVNPVRKSGLNTGTSIWKTWGDNWGDFYASPWVAYLALTGLVVALAVLHASAGWRMLPNLPKWEILALSVLMQSIVLVGTVNANFFKEDRQYRWFLIGFASYDMLMSACNFFYGYDPTVLTGTSTLPQVIIGITDLGIRLGFTVAFPLATVFFAALVKKMRAQ